jgi:arylsulfatase A-like enzyme
VESEAAVDAKRIQDPVQLLDMMPTVLDLLGVPFEGVAQGQSLLPLIQGRPFRRNGCVVSARFAQPGAKGVAPEYGTDTIALLDRDLKLIYRDQARRVGLSEVELYDRRADPAEKRNIAGDRAADTRRLRAELDKWIEGQAQVRKLLGPGGRTTLDPQSIERLRSLGYLGGKSTQ